MPKYVVRTGVMRSLAVCATTRDETLPRGAEVVVRTERGLEIGELLCEASDQAISQIKEPGNGQILR
ncbi:MAG TPA: signal peptidase, partial [Pirellulales bacterium]|nr:signal peptidase [Pirellulales bacterium]